ncbi:prophage LambdaSa2, protease [Streptococcus pneumoniae]|nr:prophage LambdaSa2, protease [Streptococcus pneumoniae]
MEKLKTFVVKSVEEESADFHFEAYASTYGNTDRDGDVMAKGCFDNTLKTKAVVPMCLNHDRNRVTGKHELSVDEKGLRTRSTFNLSDPEAKKTYDLMKMGALDSLSIGFFINDYEPVDAKQPYGGWIFKEVEIFEISVVTVPANPQATIDNIKGFDMSVVDKRIAQANMKQDIMSKLATI